MKTIEELKNKIICGDCLVELKNIPDNSIDSIVTDPPYELGFMGKNWDNTGIANNPEMWKECLRVLKPGGHLLAFSGTRTYHRMASAIEDVGFEVRDMIEWVYGSGFPKSLNIGKAVDKLQGNERETFARTDGKGTDSGSGCYNMNSGTDTMKKEFIDSKGNSEYEGWGTALKPAHEPICMARKPLSEKTVAENVLKYGTGGINIDESRVKAQGKDLERLNGEWDREWKTSYSNYADKVGGSAGFNMDKAKKENAGLTGRFPANLIHDNSEEVRECFPESKGGAYPKLTKEFTGKSNITFRGSEEREERIELDHQGNASRFFKSIVYQAKASKSERNKGCEGLEEKQKAGAEFRPNHQEKANNGETGNPFGRWNKVVNNHPTVKPIALMEYLIKMVTPNGGIVLDPFTGSGSTLIAAKQNGYQYIGIEMTEEYIPIIKARLSEIKQQTLL